jgi:hypothetical protein
VRRYCCACGCHASESAAFERQVDRVAPGQVRSLAFREVPALGAVPVARRGDVVDDPRPDDLFVDEAAPGLMCLGRSREASGARQLPA